MPHFRPRQSLRSGTAPSSPASDRLSRNEEDAAKLTYRVRKGIIKDLRFCSYHFVNSPEGIMMLQLALSQSQYFSAKLSKDVKRGIEQKLVRGERPGRV